MIAGTLITIREGLEAFLIVGILFGYLTKVNRPQFKVHVWIGTVVALAVSVLLAILFQFLALQFEGAAANIYDLPGVPWVSFFIETGIALHGTYWHNDYGRPRSRSCVNLTPGDAKFIYRWTRPEVPPDTQYLYKPGEGTLVKAVSSTS